MASTSGKPLTACERKSEMSQIVDNQAAAAESSDHQARKKTRMGELKNATLPEDLIYTEIFSRLPAKYILRCRLVCKSWNSLLSTPAFVNSHLTYQLHNNSEESDRIVIRRMCGFHDQVDILSHTGSIRVLKPRARNTLLGSINGLIAMASMSGRRFCLWNPAIGQVKLFNFPPLDDHYALGFCWDHVQNDYKVLMFCYDPMLSPARRICIYSTNSATWASLCIPQNLVLSPMPACPSTIVKGTPYWSTYPKNLAFREHKRSILKFVPEINELRILPDFDPLKFRVNYFDIANIKDRLVGMAYKLNEHGEANTMVDMYCLDDEDSNIGVWSKMYSIGPVYLDFYQWPSQAFRNGGEILIRRPSDPFAFYDPKTKEIKSIAGTTSPSTSSLIELGRQCYSYTPSLVHVRGMESLQNFSTNQPVAFFARNFP
ncbi:putative F-box protein At3g17480 [Daucus carota subsp. sativus]|uniref:putative F-box protein At3g17480 n=1 Tax=Daucus carota subsp. sativus TaxID=79200 RepID=UPI0007EEF772|nr:PREDICTED: putative F-box protein At3g17480 [Daucus carota subsp. sativus]